jgi:PA14 domain/Immunoglobulin domain
MNLILMKKLRPCSWLRCGVAVSLAALSCMSIANAHPYASGVTNNSGTVQFILNEDADSLYVVLNDGTTNTLTPTKGTHAFSLGANTNYAIYAFKVGTHAFTQISADANTYVDFFYPRGVAVNQNPQRPNFGRVYVVNSCGGTGNNSRPVGKGIYVLNADQSDALGRGNTALLGGMTLGTSARYSPYKISVGVDDTVYIGDIGGQYTAGLAAGGASAGSYGYGVWAAKPDMSSSEALFNLADAVPNGNSLYGGVTSTPVVRGSLGQPDFVVYALEWDKQQGATYNNLWEYTANFDNSLPLVNAPTYILNPNTGTSLANAVLADLAIHPTTGYIYTMQNRSADNTITLGVWDPSNLTGGRLWSSTPPGTTHDVMVNSFGIAISPDGTLLANSLGSGKILVTMLTNGVPDLGTIVTNSTASTLNYKSGVTWDAANNLYATFTPSDPSPVGSSCAGVMRVYSLGQNTLAVTRNDSTSTNGTFQFMVFKPTITNQPASQVVVPGSTATFSVGVGLGLPPYKYQWRFFGSNIVDATTSLLTIPNAQVTNGGLYSVFITDSGGLNTTSQDAILTVGTLGTGTGLTGDYYSSATDGVNNFVGTPTLTRTDATVNFDWGTDSPDPAISADAFMVRWHGQVQPFYSQTYTFTVRSDDGARLWVNGQRIIDSWIPQSAADRSGSIALNANREYDLVLEYFEASDAASAQLSWASANQAKQIIPQTQLYPAAGSFTPVLNAGVVNGTNFVIDWAGTCALLSATNVLGPWAPVAPNNIVGPYTTNITGADPQMFFRLQSQ